MLKKIDNLIYKLDLPELIKIYSIISIAQLEPASDPSEDPYKRARTPVLAVEEIVDNALELTAKQFKSYEIEKLLDRRGEPSPNTKYLVK